MLNPFNRTLQGVFWLYREKVVPLHCHSKKGCTRHSSSKLDSALFCTFFALSKNNYYPFKKLIDYGTRNL